MNFLSSAIWKLFAGTAFALALTILWLRSAHYAERARTSEALLKGAVAIGNANAEVARLQSGLARRIGAVEALHAVRMRDLRRQSQVQRKVINDAPPSADGPLAPILRNQLDRLPERTGTDPHRDLAAAAASTGASPAQ